MQEKESYLDWFNSPFHHKLYSESDEKEAEAFIHRLVTHLRIEPGSRTLDAACGRGREARMIVAKGFDTTAVDISPLNIEYAKQFTRDGIGGETDHLHFFVHDIRLPFWGNYFDCAFNLFTRFGFFRTRREHEAAIRTIAQSLKPGGLFVIDYLNVHYTEEHMLPGTTRRLNGTTYDIEKWDDESYFYKTIKVSDPSLNEPSTFTEKIAKFTLGDFTDMLSYQDMQVQEVFGDYNLSGYDVKKTPRLIIVARKIDSRKEDKEKRLYSDGRTTDALT